MRGSRPSYRGEQEWRQRAGFDRSDHLALGIRYHDIALGGLGCRSPRWRSGDII